MKEIKANDTEICPNWWYVSEEAEDAIEWINGRDGKDRMKKHRTHKFSGPKGPGR